MIKRILAAVAVICLSVTSVHACAYGGGRRNPIETFVGAERIVVGKVVRFEDRTRIVPYGKGSQPIELLIMVVEITESLKGADGLTHLRVAIPPTSRVFSPVQPTISGYQLGQEVCLSLRSHFLEPFHLVDVRAGMLSVVNKVKPGKGWSKTHENELAAFRRLAKVNRNPLQSLASKDKAERMIATAFVLLENEVRMGRVGQPGFKKSTMSPQMSRLLMLNLAEADWGKSIIAVDRDYRTRPESLFWQLNRRASVQWKAINYKTAEEYHANTKQWCRDNAETIRISTAVAVN